MEKLKENEKKQKELEKEKLNSELAFLKNQVSPHFFFNTLNNIYSLIGIDGPTAQDSVLKLSKLMRYLLYESEHGETQMSHEIDFMNNYIDLMKLRLSQRVELQIDFPEEFSDFTIPPLLFVPFIENAFKHGVSSRDRSFIIIRLEIENLHIRFTAENSIGKGHQASDMQHSGIGLENVRKRLGLLFPWKHELLIEETEKIFRVDLNIQIEKRKA
jgi:LytS/YehU family sensor histidine kinase